MAGLGCFKCNASGFSIANLSNQNDVRILPQNGAQSGREGDVCLGVDLDLVYAFKLILNGVFDCDDVLGRDLTQFSAV